MIIKRSNIIKALLTEPLKTSNFICTDNSGKFTSKCKVCAVGATLRQSGVKSRDIYAKCIDYFKGERCYAGFEYLKVPHLLRNGRYLEALSVYFEHTCASKLQLTKGDRRELVKFVKENFPKQFEVEGL